MTGVQAFAMVGVGLMLTGCGDRKSGTEDAALAPARLTAATLGEQVVLPTRDYLDMPPYADADAEAGLRLSSQCRACHTFERSGVNMAGPNLYGVFGRRVASADGYAYSPALEQADFLWTPRALDAWLADPAGFLPGNRMAYAGLRNSADRNAVVAALLRETSADPGARNAKDEQSPTEAIH